MSFNFSEAEAGTDLGLQAIGSETKGKALADYDANSNSKDAGHFVAPLTIETTIIELKSVVSAKGCPNLCGAYPGPRLFEPKRTSPPSWPEVRLEQRRKLRPPRDGITAIINVTSQDHQGA
ncbi:MAG: hypothetical protein IH973_01210 [Myxococcales bacterium]|nr:hypothetical protein [Myxococcales bacterium]